MISDKNIPRFKLIEALCIHYGGFKRIQLQRAYGLEIAAVGRTVRAYRDANPDALTHSRGLKINVPSATFKPMFLTVDAEDYIAASEMTAVEPIIITKRVFI